MILPTVEERRIVSFWVFPNLAYGTRVALAFTLFAIGLVFQAIMELFLPGGVFLFAGTLLLLVRGYHNRVEFGSLDPDAHWETVPVGRLEELQKLDRKMLEWDRSLMDISNPLGALIFVLLTAGLVFGGLAIGGLTGLLFFDALVVLLPHWITGQRRLLRLPGLLIQVNLTRKVIEEFRDRLAKHVLKVNMLLRGGDTAIPEDLKLKVDIADHDPDFLGLYGQTVLNDVQGTSYPYFYVVLVAKKGYGLRKAFEKYHEPPRITAEFKTQDQVEVLVIRQHTTKRSGYHTKPHAAERIFGEGLDLAEQVA